MYVPSRLGVICPFKENFKGAWHGLGQSPYMQRPASVVGTATSPSGRSTHLVLLPTGNFDPQEIDLKALSNLFLRDQPLSNGNSALVGR